MAPSEPWGLTLPTNVRPVLIWSNTAYHTTKWQEGGKIAQLLPKSSQNSCPEQKAKISTSKHERLFNNLTFILLNIHV